MRTLTTFCGLLLSALLLTAQPDPEAELAEKYFNDGEYEAALELYEKVFRKNETEPFAKQIVNCYYQLQQYDEALKFLDRQLKRSKENIIYPVMKGMALQKAGNQEEADKLLENTIRKDMKTEGNFVQAGTYLYQEGELNLALETYEQGRKRLKADRMFSDEIANIHLQLGNYESATEEYLNSYYESPQDESSVKLSILNMVNTQSSEAIERALIKATDKSPTDYGLRKMLFEYYVLAENFEEAFIQVKSIDRLFDEDGGRIFDFGVMMRNSKQYGVSNRAFEYLINRKKNTPYLYQAQEGIAINGELLAFESIPVDLEAVQQAITAYKSLMDEFGRRPENFEAIYRYANLNVFYLNELDKALMEMEQITGMLNIRDQRDRQKFARAQLLAGDILVMKKDYNNAKLAYERVSDLYRDRQLGALAKYKLAQLSYFKGDFNLAQAQLSAIKDNTSNDISNDAIKLNLVIMDNTGLDTTTTALELFAQAQLLAYQREYDASLALMDSLAYQFPNHPLADEIYWEKANIFLKQNDIPTALEYLEKILENFPQDIYGDDALYTKARIFDYNLKDKDAAMKIYLDFLVNYPGSLFSVSARKRIRELRNDSPGVAPGLPDKT